MDGSLDIYSYLIIAIISFIAPLIVYSLGIFNEGPDLIEKNAKEIEKQTKKLIELASQKEDYDPEVVEKSNKSLKELRIRSEKQIALLTPENQISRLFGPLILALIFVMLFKLIQDDVICVRQPIIRIGIIIASVASFMLGLYFLKQVTLALIDTQRLVYKKKTSENVESVEKVKSVK